MRRVRFVLLPVMVGRVAGAAMVALVAMERLRERVESEALPVLEERGLWGTTRTPVDS
jgi:hypothetical protein